MKLKSILLIAFVALFASCGKKTQNTEAVPAVEATEVASETPVAEPLPLGDLLGQLRVAIEENGDADKALEIFLTIGKQYPVDNEAWNDETSAVLAEWIMAFYDIASTEQMQKYEEMAQ